MVTCRGSPTFIILIEIVLVFSISSIKIYSNILLILLITLPLLNSFDLTVNLDILSEYIQVFTEIMSTHPLFKLLP